MDAEHESAHADPCGKDTRGKHARDSSQWIAKHIDRNDERKGDVERGGIGRVAGGQREVGFGDVGTSATRKGRPRRHNKKPARTATAPSATTLPISDSSREIEMSASLRWCVNHRRCSRSLRARPLCCVTSSVTPPTPTTATHNEANPVASATTAATDRRRRTRTESRSAADR